MLGKIATLGLFYNPRVNKVFTHSLSHVLVSRVYDFGTVATEKCFKASLNLLARNVICKIATAQIVLARNLKPLLV